MPIGSGSSVSFAMTIKPEASEKQGNTDPTENNNQQISRQAR
jgi:hypothetical protein